jgi:D-3-phosphoglycerate dehydrogenase
VRKSCLIIDKTHESIVPLLEGIGYEADYRPDIQREELMQIIGKYVGLIVRSKTNIDKALIEKASRLKFVARAGAGVDQIDVEVLQSRHIHLLNAPEGNRDALAEHAMGMLLCLLNKIHWADQQVRKGIWDREGNRGVELMGKTVALIGYGFMGQAFARRLSGFGVQVLAYDKYRQNYGDAYAREASMEQIFEQTDILSFHIPLTTETQHMVDVSYLNSFKRNIYLINTARGEIIKLEVLVKMLESGKLKGAVLDVLENEKLNRLTPSQQAAFNKIIQSERVIFTPHVAGWTYESYEKINRVLASKIKLLNL